MSVRGWPRRLALLLVGLGWLALAHPQAQDAPQLEWTHSGTSVTHFECFVDSAYAGSLGLPTPTGTPATTYSADLSLCGQITAGQHTLSVKACNYTNCTDTGMSLALVALGTIGSGTEACVGPAQADVQAAVTAADYGDKVQVCAGSATWTAASQGCTGNSMLCMKKGIYLVGGIGGTTTITLSGAATYGAICYEPDATSRTNDTPFSFTGFTVDAGGVDYGEGMLDVRNSGTTALTKIVIHDNVFQNGAVDGHAILINGPTYGVAYDNLTIDIGTSVKVEGMDTASWNLNHRAYGTANSFFYEDNTMSFTDDTVEDYGYTAGQGGSLVHRYNTINAANNTSGNELGDLHGLQSMSGSNVTCDGVCLWPTTPCYTETSGGTRCCSQWSQVKSELYGNAWTNLNNTGGYTYWMIHRGSWMLMFSNAASGTYAGGYLLSPKYRQYSCDECQNPAETAYSQHIQNTYVWGNFHNGAIRPYLPIVPRTNHNPYETADLCADGVGTYEITENVDYFNYNASFDGTTGIGCGTVANLPATCTTGVGYWATTQSCSDMTGMVGANPAAPISGTLYKCTSTNTWTAYYTPYTYPHPKAATPAAASGLRVK